MKKYFVSLIILIFSLSSCKNNWNEDDKISFKKACLDDAAKWIDSKEKANTYCNCMIEKILLKHPLGNVAIDHLDSLINDPQLKSCKTEILK